MDAASAQYVAVVASTLTTILDQRSNLVGIYLHGSGVLGGFVARKSDIDILAVVQEPMTSDEQHAVAERLNEERLPCPAHGLEMSIATLQTAQNPNSSPLPPFELHMNTDPTDSKLVDGHQREGNAELIFDFEIYRQAGQPLTLNSRPTIEAFAPIDRRMIIERLEKDLTWATDPDNAPGEYAVLNSCRAWKFVADGEFVSKIAGGQWAMDHVSEQDRGLIRKAMDLQRCLSVQELDRSLVRKFVDEVLLRISNLQKLS